MTEPQIFIYNSRAGYNIRSKKVDILYHLTKYLSFCSLQFVKLTELYHPLMFFLFTDMVKILL